MVFWFGVKKMVEKTVKTGLGSGVFSASKMAKPVLKSGCLVKPCFELPKTGLQAEGDFQLGQELVHALTRRPLQGKGVNRNWIKETSTKKAWEKCLSKLETK